MLLVFFYLFSTSIIIKGKKETNKHPGHTHTSESFIIVYDCFWTKQEKENSFFFRLWIKIFERTRSTICWQNNCCWPFIRICGWLSPLSNLKRISDACFVSLPINPISSSFRKKRNLTGWFSFHTWQVYRKVIDDEVHQPKNQSLEMSR